MRGAYLDKTIGAMNRSRTKRFEKETDCQEEPMQPTTESRAARHRGPPLAAVAVVYTALVLAGVFVPIALAGGQHLPSPFDPEAARWFAEHPSAASAAAFFVFGSSIPLGIFAATASSRLQFLGMRVAGNTIALFGGVGASAALATSGFALWTLAEGATGDTDVAHALHLFAFAAGGPGFVVPFGLLVAGISVSGGVQRFLPRWLMVLGVAVAVAAELSFFALAWLPAIVLLPVARFLGLVWMIATGVLLPVQRPSRKQNPSGEQKVAP